MNDNSRFQRFLWTVAGAEISILEQKECRTDHKKFAAIGATILMTTIIAFFAGSSAAWFFTQSGEDTSGNILGSMAFGVLWATLIFTIDRSLVITLKKNPELKKQKWIVPFFSRAALAVLIAFMVSIPLELMIFEDFIAVEEFNFNDAENKDYIKGKQETKDKNEISSDISNTSNSITALDNANKQNENAIANYQRQLLAIQQKRTRKSTANTNMVNAKSRMEKLYGQHGYEDAKKEYEQKKRIYESISSVTREDETKERNLKSDIERLNNDIENNKNRAGELSVINAQLSLKREGLRTVIDSTAQKRDSVAQRGNQFIRKFRILEYAVNVKDTVYQTIAENTDSTSVASASVVKSVGLKHPTEFLFLWLIRVLFFIVEILPTVVKIVMPVGSYDRMVHAEEKSIEQYIGSDDYKEKLKQLHLAELESRNKLVEQQQEIEAELKAEILKQVKEAQLEIATLAVNKWREREKAKQEKLYSQPDTQNDDEDVDEEEMTYSAV